MAMLAEPRRRKRYNLCPRGKALYEDDSRFGTKMLEKMGWTKGRGLGANEDGQQEFVRVRLKNDSEGLGFEARDDQWTTHDEGFNGLLKALNGEAGDEQSKEANGIASGSEDDLRPAVGFGFKNTEPPPPSEKKQLKEKISGVSLEERSKISKARVHYKKFTRGKDLSQYSEKDLANIFGKKATEDTEEPIKEATPPVEKEDNPNFAGVQTVSTGLSVSDYFKQKMEAMKNRLKNESDTKPLITVNKEGSDKMEDEPMEEPPKKKKKKKDKERELAEQPETIEEESLPKKKKKSKILIENVENTKEDFPEPEDEATITKRKKKKNKTEKNEEIALVEIVKTKKKKKDKPQIEAEASIELVQNVEDSPASCNTGEPSKPSSRDSLDEEPPKKKKKKSKNKEQDNEILAKEDELIPEIKKSKKKKSKNADKEALLEATPEDTKSEQLLEDNPPDESNVKTKKNKKKSKTEDKEDNLPTNTVSAATSSSGDISNSSQPSTEMEMNDDLLSLEQIHEKLKSFDVFEISTFCAEKFHMFNMSAFENASLHQLPGYGLSENVELKVVNQPFDAQRLIDLWNNCGSTYESIKSRNNTKYPKMVKSSTIRAVKKRKVFAAI